MKREMTFSTDLRMRTTIKAFVTPDDLREMADFLEHQSKITKPGEFVPVVVLDSPEAEILHIHCLLVYKQT